MGGICPQEFLCIFSTFHHGGSTEVPLLAARRPIKCRAVPSKTTCEELDALKRAAVGVLREVKRIRRSRDLSFHEDAELCGRKRISIHAVLKHLLVGHEGKPCPGGTRPIVGARSRYF